MENLKIKEYKEKLKNLGYEIIEEKDEDQFSFVNRNSGVIMTIYDSEPGFGLLSLLTAHYPQDGHGDGWIYLRKVSEIKDIEFPKAEMFMMKKFSSKEEKPITVEEFLRRNEL